MKTLKDILGKKTLHGQQILLEILSLKVFTQYFLVYLLILVPATLKFTYAK